MGSRQAGTEHALELPPGFRLVSLRERGDAFAHAVAIAADAGAGTLVSAWRYDLAELAVVLEPDEPLETARRAFFVGMNAMGDAIATHCAPDRSVRFGWPDAIVFDGGLVGGVRLGAPPGCAEAAVPAWLVLGAMVRLADMAQLGEAGVGETSLLGAAFEMVDSAELVASFARHLMTGFDTWNAEGFAPVAAAYLARLDGEGKAERRLDDNGDLLIRAARGARPARASLVAGLARAAWLDTDAGRPRLG